MLKKPQSDGKIFAIESNGNQIAKFLLILAELGKEHPNMVQIYAKTAQYFNKNPNVQKKL